MRNWPPMSVMMHDGHIDQEDRSVPEVLQQRAAGDGAEGHGDARGGAPDPERLLPLGVIGEDAGEDGQAGREDEGGGHPHQGPGGDEGAGRMAHGGGGREEAEEDEPDLHDALATQPVAHATAGQAAVRQRPGCRRRRSTAAR